MTSNFQPGYTNAGTLAWDNLLSGDAAVPAVTESAVIDTGVLTRGALLGKVTATGKYVLSTAGASDGSQVPRAILAEPCDATAADVTTVVYKSGQFNSSAVTFGAGHTLASVRDALESLGIYFKTNVPA